MTKYKKLYKIFTVIIIILILLSVGEYILRFRLILPEFSNLEQQEDTKDMNGVTDAISREVYHLGQIASDWASWDDMYAYVRNKNKAFEKSNFPWETLNASGIDLIYICSSAGKLVWGGIHDPDLNKDIKLKEFPGEFCSSGHQAGYNKQQPIQRDKKYEQSSGIILTEHGPMMIIFRPILTSKGTGPSRGTLIMGRFLRKNILRELAKQTHVAFTVKNLQNSTITGRENYILTQLTQNKKIVFKKVSSKVLRGYCIIKDIWGKPALLVTADFPREIMQHGKTTARMVSFTILTTFTIICLFIIIWFISFRAESLRRQKKIENLVNERTCELQESEERLRTLINATPDIICFKDGDGRWLEANRADLELFHLIDTDYRGKKDSELAEYTHPVFRESFLLCEETDNQAWISGHQFRSHEKIVTPDDSVKIYDTIKVPLFHPDGRRKGIIVFGRDITQETILQDKLQKAEKMKAIGLTAGGVAHDLNNILAGLVGYPDLLLINLPPDSELRRPIETIRESGKRASEVVADLLTIARGVAATKEVTNLNILIDEYLESPECKKIKKLYPNINCETRLDPDLLNVLCSPIHIKKCIMNLLNNAAEAISGNGHIIITTKNQYVDQPLAGNQYMDRGEYAVVNISDTGPGIPEKDIDRIFEPFYTKKEMGRSGTGLGLTVVWNTVQDHEGGVQVTSNDTGTSFELYFPATRGEMPEHAENIRLEELHGNGESILVVDDEPQQQEIAEKMLTALKYQVKCVGSGEEAVKYLQKKSVDLVVLDMIMDPGINGRQTYEQIIKIHPGQKAVIVSGFSENEDVKEAQRQGAGEFVKKPYMTVQIGMAVKQILNA